MAPGLLESPVTQPASRPTVEHIERIKAAADDNYGKYYPADPKSLTLESNFGPMDPETVGYLQPTSVNTPLEIMHERFQRDGYLFVRQTMFFRVSGED